MTLRSTLLILTFLLANFWTSAQAGWLWTELPSMPRSVSNNAVTQAYCGDTLCVYSFCGIDSTKSPLGINLGAYRYNTISQVWSQLPDVPDTQGKIAAGATTVNNKIYLIGGYYVEENFSEESSDDVHIFNPETNSWEDDGTNIPVPIDDHVQALWNDSLVFVVTGWSNTGNVNNVQIYDPANDSWQVGTPTPNSSLYKAFGASGDIIGDSIFYYGGAAGFSFNSINRLRRGLINPNNPTEIEWSIIENVTDEDAYRSAATSYDNRLIWIGGSGISYNFDGIAYNGSGGVPPLPHISTYYSTMNLFEVNVGVPYGVMDLRGIARAGESSWIICGGMQENQTVSNKTYLLELDPSVAIHEANSLQNGSNAWADQEFLFVNYSDSSFGTCTLYNIQGEFIFQRNLYKGTNRFSTNDLSMGLYIVQLRGDSGVVYQQKILVN